MAARKLHWTGETGRVILWRLYRGTASRANTTSRCRPRLARPNPHQLQDHQPIEVARIIDASYFPRSGGLTPAIQRGGSEVAQRRWRGG